MAVEIGRRRQRGAPAVRLRVTHAVRVGAAGDETFARTRASRPRGGERLQTRRRGAGSGAVAAKRVLVVDDEPSMRLLCTANLGFAGFEVGEAENGLRALERAGAEDFDLVLLDVMLPDIGGHEVAVRLGENERTQALPVVFLSARASRDDLRAGYELGAIDYITKPFDPVELGARVDEIFARIERGESEAFRLARLVELAD